VFESSLKHVATLKLLKKICHPFEPTKHKKLVFIIEHREYLVYEKNWQHKYVVIFYIIWFLSYHIIYYHITYC